MSLAKLELSPHLNSMLTFDIFSGDFMTIKTKSLLSCERPRRVSLILSVFKLLRLWGFF